MALNWTFFYFMAKHPGLSGCMRTNFAAERKCPGQRHNSGTNGTTTEEMSWFAPQFRDKCCRRKKMSRKAPQFRDELDGDSGNVPESATIPGRNQHPQKIVAPMCKKSHIFLYFCMILTKIRLNYVTYCRLRFYKS